MFSYLVNARYGEGSKLPILLQGLDAAKNYEVREVGLYPSSRSAISTAVYSGDYLMKIGFNPVVNARRASVVLTLTEK